MDITTLNTPQNSAASSQREEALSQTDFGSEFDTFLTLLTAQIKNQDPLAPLDSTQFVEQLATFSSLEQQVRGNQLLENIAGTISQLGANAASDWVGKTVEVQSSYVPFGGKPVSFNADIPANIDKAVLHIEDSEGTLIKTHDLTLNEPPWVWDGSDNDGSVAQNGLYQIRVDLFQQGEFSGSLAPRLISDVTQASMENGKIRLGLENHLSAFAENVRKSK